MCNHLSFTTKEFPFVADTPYLFPGFCFWRQLFHNWCKNSWQYKAGSNWVGQTPESLCSASIDCSWPPRQHESSPCPAFCSGTYNRLRWVSPSYHCPLLLSSVHRILGCTHYTDNEGRFWGAFFVSTISSLSECKWPAKAKFLSIKTLCDLFGKCHPDCIGLMAPSMGTSVRLCSNSTSK